MRNKAKFIRATKLSALLLLLMILVIAMAKTPG